MRWRTSASSGTASWTSSCPSSGERIYVKLMSEKCVLGQTNKTITSQDEICGNFLHLKSILLQARKPANKSPSGHIYKLLMFRSITDQNMFLPYIYIYIIMVSSLSSGRIEDFSKVFSRAKTISPLFYKLKQLFFFFVNFFINSTVMFEKTSYRN